jgi:dihydroorotate dehydrogenase (NAD+) catalytic subunit
LDIIPKIAESGAGAMVTKSIGLEPSSGYRNPTIVEVDSGYVNAIGLSNPGIAEFCREVSEIKDKRIPIIVSLFGSKSEDFAVMIKRLEKLDIDCYELNLSCPHVDKVGLEIGQDPKEVSRIVEVSKKYSSKPILVKISPNVTDILGIVAAAENDIETGLPILSNRIGGLSGPAIKPIAIRCVYEISSNFEIPIIGCGGISNWRDVVEFMMAGASAVQIGTAAGLKGLHLFKEILNDLEDYIEKNNYRSIGNIIGLAHSRK